MQHLERLFASLAIAVLSGCGGSGDTSSNTQTLAITAASPPVGTTGTAYASYAFTASGGAPPLSWTESGPLPTGLALSASGQLSGMPVAAGTYPVTITITDSSMPPHTASVAVSLKINDSPIVIAPVTPPNGYAGDPYAGFSFSASGGSRPFSWKVTSGSPPPGLTVGTDGSVSGTPTTTGMFFFSVTATDSARQPVASPPLATQIAVNLAPLGANAASTFIPTSGEMTVARAGHTATRLLDGRVLVTGGGALGGATTVTAELYHPTAETFSATGNMTTARAEHTAVLLANVAKPKYGYVLIAGGNTQIAELYNPATGAFTVTGSMTQGRVLMAATLLNNGKALFVGGNQYSDLRAELYDPASGTFTPTGATHVLRIGPTATLLLDGRVLVAGGATGGGEVTATAELYNPLTGTFSTTGSMTIPRYDHTATRLNDGSVVVVGTEGTIDRYDPVNGTFARMGSLQGAAAAHTATLLPDGSVLVAGGLGYKTAPLYVLEGPICRATLQTAQYEVSLGASEIVLAGNGGVLTVASLITPRHLHTATLLADGSVLIVGGIERTIRLSKSPIYPSRTPCVWVPNETTLPSAELFK